MLEKKEYITKLADFLITTKTTMNVENLAEHLNWNGYKTNYDTEYQGKRGTYTLIHSTYDYLVEKNRQNDADKVAKAFKKPNGNYAYE